LRFERVLGKDHCAALGLLGNYVACYLLDSGRESTQAAAPVGPHGTTCS
jgi:hypothetical protein